MAIKNGVDLNCGPQYENFLAPAVERGLVSKQTVATAAVRVLEHQMALGIFDGTTPYDGLDLGLVGSSAHASTAYDAAVQGIILLKNERRHLPLPLNDSGLRVAVLGPHANSSTDHDGGILGAYSNPDNTAVLNQTMLLAAERHLGAGNVIYSPGCDSLACPNRSGFAAATAAARQADVAVLFLGISGLFEAETRDRNACSKRPWDPTWDPPDYCPGPNPEWKHGYSVGLALPGNQTALALAVIEANPNTVVVLIHGGMVLVDDIVTTGASVVSALYPGQQGGDAVWDILTGHRSPAGKLPYTWYSDSFEAERGQINDQDLRAGLGITYRYYRGSPVFRYGHGLSYTSWRYSWASAPPSTLAVDAAAAGTSLSVSVSNTGSVASDCVVLVFGSLNGTHCPLRTLVGFGRLAMVPMGAAATISIDVAPRTLGCVDAKGIRTLAAGTLSLEAGDVVSPAKHNLTLTGKSRAMPM